MEIMTDKQFDKIILMFEMILEGCKDLEDAKKNKGTAGGQKGKGRMISRVIRRSEGDLGWRTKGRV